MERIKGSSTAKVMHTYGDIKSDRTVTIDNFLVKQSNNRIECLDSERIIRSIAWACVGYEDTVSLDLIMQEVCNNIFDGIMVGQIADALILSASAFIERDPAYGYVASRLLLKKLYKQVVGISVLNIADTQPYEQAFVNSITKGVDSAIFTKQLLEFDLPYLASQLVPERDNLFDFMGLRTLYERYFVRHQGGILELPQIFWMRVAMGLAIEEKDKNARAIEFYRVMSLLHYVPSTPTLLHAGLMRPQLSSCFLGTVEDDLRHIFKCFSDQAQLSKWSGGVAYDWTNIRAIGAMVNSIKTESQGVVPFLKIANDTTAAINRSGKRRGASVVYLETWHMEIEDFLDLRRNTGDERRRTHDINTAHWIPDLFMKRVRMDEKWTLFSPHEVPDLHHIYGQEFEKRYVEYEDKACSGEIELYKEISAKELWRKMLSRLFETGHPWFTFKDACNIRSPQDHAGVIHNSNLCTEITLNNSADETAVCNLGSVNLARHIADNKIDTDLLAKTVATAITMLDNVIDINFYPTIETYNANIRHRPVGLGIMGLQDAFYQLNIAFDDQQALIFSEESMEFIAYHAILASSKLAQERGSYQSYKGSKWDRDIFPQDTIDILQQERGVAIAGSRTGALDWTPVRQQVKKYGMRNSNVMAIAPTATISNISGCFPCIEPIYKNIYVKANMSGEFTVINKYLINDLKKLNLWNADMLDQIKYYDGNVQMIDAIPAAIKHKYKEAFEIDALWIIKMTASRGKWIDQSQSCNIFLQGVSGKKLGEIYMAAWESGLKTMYYLRTMGASQIEKSTLDAKKFGYTQKRDYKMGSGVESAGIQSTDNQAIENQAIDKTEKTLNTIAMGNDMTTENGGSQNLIIGAKKESLSDFNATVDSYLGNEEFIESIGATCSISADPECDVCQ